MFAKVFSQIFTSSISKDRVVRYGFMDLLVLADRDGVVDMTAEAIARITNVPIDVVSYYLAELQKPDTESRTPSEDGCRIVLLSDHRNWGWKIVNYHHYRELRSEDDRREYMRTYMRKRRVNSSKQMLAPLAKADTDTDTDTEAKTFCAERFQLPLNDGTFFPITDSQIAKWTLLYPAVDVKQAIRSMIGWSESNPTKRKTSRGIQRFVNSWLDKEQNRSHSERNNSNGKKQSSFSRLFGSDETTDS